MPEQEPQYFKDFRKEINKRFDEQDKFIVKTVTTVVNDAVEELAIMTLKCFDRLEKRVGVIEEDVSDIKENIVRIDNHLVRIDGRLDKIEENGKHHDVRVKKLERTVFA